MMKNRKRTVHLNFLILFMSVLFISTALYGQDFYWENPVLVSSGDARFPKVAANETDTYLFYQRVDEPNHSITLYAQRNYDTNKWKDIGAVAGPFPYSGEVPDMYSAAVSPSGTVAVAVLSDTNAVSVFYSTDNGNSFTETAVAGQNGPFVAPRIYAASAGGFMLFAAAGENETFSMLSSFSEDGISWPDLAVFGPAAALPNPFVPVLSHTAVGDIVVFQAQYNNGRRFSYQLYSTVSTDNCRTWSAPVLITDSTSFGYTSGQDFSSYQNQRPFLYTVNGSTYISWERTHYTSENSHIWFGTLNSSGELTGRVDEITTTGKASRPILFSYDGTVSLVWFDTRNGTETVYFSQKKGYLWNEVSLSKESSASLFAYPALTNSGTTLSFFWEQDSVGSKKNHGIYLLAPDKSVSKPTITAVSFKDGRRSSAEKVSVRVNLPKDSSGIAGFSWAWTQNKDTEPPEKFMNLPSQRELDIKAVSDGEWYFKSRVVDYAGNWSDSASVTYFKDTTPPGRPTILPAALDRFGFSTSNTFTMKWSPDSSDDDVAGYTWDLRYVAPLDKRITETKKHPFTISDDEVGLLFTDFMTKHTDASAAAPPPPSFLKGSSEEADYYNRRNGLYTFSVAAIDTVGNIGKAATVTVVLNKYVPSTSIISLSVDKNVYGDLSVDIYGGGFTYDGTISEIYVDKDGMAPYDFIFSRSKGQFKVLSDSHITDLEINREITAGKYRIGLLHPDRGLYMSSPRLTVSETGTVKVQRSYEYEPSWLPVKTAEKWQIGLGNLLLVIVFIFVLLGLFFTSRGLLATVKEASITKLEVRALLTGDTMPLVKKERRTAELKQKGVSLRIKLMAFSSALVLMIVLFVALPLEMIMTGTQERTLSRGLQDRVNVLMESLSSGVHSYMPSRNLLELSFLPDQSSALDEAEYATIVGFPAAGNTVNLDYVWATNDENIENKIDTSALVYGSSRLTSVKDITDRCTAVNKDAIAKVGDLASQITELNAEGIALAVKTDDQSVKRREEIGTITTDLNTRLNTILSTISQNGSGSFPAYNTERLDRHNTSYLFYKPVLYRQGTDKNYVRAIVLVQISTENLIKSVNAARTTILATVAVIAAIAIMAGAVGSWIVATQFVKPIKRLASYVAMIGETRHKEKLAGKVIEINSKDEIGLLGESVNEMTQGLAKAAMDENLLMDGKVVQQTFLPLVTDRNGHKETTAELNDEKIQCFGYYEGASAVSGDYFDYKKLDDRWYVIIKCDASGHGVPAALIMTIVATLFRKYYEDWTYKAHGHDINKLVVIINDFIESLGIKGKFATLILCLLDSQTGDVYLCNAGDNIVHLYDSRERKQKIITLAETPAAGPMPSFMINAKGGFKVEKYHINRGDVLFLYTDGIEEATRVFRSAETFERIKCAEPGLSDGEEHGNHKRGDETEQFEPSRVNGVIEAVFNRTVYRLEKYHNPAAGEILEFDFTACKGTIQEAIVGLAAVEKVFRMYKSPDATGNDLVRVDRKIDAFLKDHFNLYGTYCSERMDDPSDTVYVYYTHLQEDEQLDDLTLVAVRLA
ncbi:MAG: SpoIIE family protein phosphatase [Treponema sp.]|nr:SpoIIE family protein phosphatase [Treponema sp.]